LSVDDPPELGVTGVRGGPDTVGAWTIRASRLELDLVTAARAPLAVAWVPPEPRWLPGLRLEPAVVLPLPACSCSTTAENGA
jgi:hypothetical protein